MLAHSKPRFGAALAAVKIPLVVALAACLALGCAPGGDSVAEATGTLEGSDDPALATVQINGVVVGVVGAGLVVENHSANTLKSVVIVVNEGGSQQGYRFRVAQMGPHTTNTYLTDVFRNPDGVSLDTNAITVTNFALYADTDQGRGVWRGAY